MTGYHSGEYSWALENGSKLVFGVEVKTLNGRYFEVISKLPNELFGEELQIQKIFKNKLIRGKVFLTVRLLPTSDQGSNQLQVNTQLVQAYLGAAKQISEITGGKIDIEASSWLELPKIINFENQNLTEKDRSNLCELVEGWAEGVFKQRVNEGHAIIKDLEASLVQIKSLNSKIVTINAQTLQNLQTAVSRQKQAWETAKIDDNEHLTAQEYKKFLETEHQLNKSDVNEETQRIGMHLESIANLFSSSNYEVGKKLDFTLQELLRETNTIGSKISDYQISSKCVEIKFELEKLREQAQNIV